MRIAQISTLAAPVTADAIHSIEQLVWLMADELTKLGHDVTVFATAGSSVSGRLVATLPGPYAAPGSLENWQTCEWVNLCRALERSDEFDVLHSHAYLWGLPLQPFARSPFVHTLHVQPFDNEAALRSMYPTACVTAISHYQWSVYPDLPPAAVIHHGVAADQFPFQSQPGDYLCFLGRFLPEKGVLEAITMARSAGLRLLLAGARNDYFTKCVEPLLDDREVVYVGPVSGSERSRLLGGARALLYPIQQPEPFGLVQIEAMMCGTPVVATGIGAVREIVDEGVTGVFTDASESTAATVQRAIKLDRRGVRERAIARFSAERMARQYVEVYQHAIQRSAEYP